MPVKCPTPLRDRTLLDWIQEQHDLFSRERRLGSFAVEFHYDHNGVHTITHRGPVIRERPVGPDPKVLTLD